MVTLPVFQTSLVELYFLRYSTEQGIKLAALLREALLVFTQNSDAPLHWLLGDVSLLESFEETAICCKFGDLFQRHAGPFEFHEEQEKGNIGLCELPDTALRSLNAWKYPALLIKANGIG